ncbi:MAG: chemotaxis protein CheA, partial [Anaeromyxobacteraceae bacterium]|nr:chemotaxis protein CheA [Anaeromyxobacteraceae bacterium]
QPQAPAEGAAGGSQLRETVKVDLERVDSMVEMIGELIIVESMVVHAPEIAQLTSLKVRNYLNQLTKISRDLQNVAMRMRMVPVRGAFQKMARLVRDLSRKSGKDIVLEQSGEDTEMDRSMVERIEDPLVHLVRNSIDHGTETAQERKAAGKPARAVIRLSAYHEGGSIVVELSDDGRGLQKEKILAKAREKGLVEEGRDLSEQEIYNLIFLPGFSTAARVTEISGRGVGMDVVKRNIEGMRGRVSVSSRPGQGTTFKMVLPLTLAIIEGMLIACGKEKYIIPSLSIVESLRPTEDMISLAAGRGEIINVRGEILPLLRLHRLLQMEGAERSPTEGHVVVLEGLGRKVGIVVDDVLTQQQVVIKPLGQGIGDTDFLSGAAILSDGRVGLILNVDRLSSLAASGGGHREAAAVGA